MKSTNYEIIKFLPNFEQFNELSKILLETSQAHECKRLWLTDDEAKAYLTSCLKVYAVLTLRSYLIESGELNHHLKMLKEVVPNIPVPRFFRDVFREFVRPMRDRSTIYIPKIEIPTLDTDIYEAYGFDSSTRAKITMMLKDQGVDTVTLDVEILKPAPPTVYHKHAIHGEYILSRGPVPEYRRQAESILQHFRFEDRVCADVRETMTELSLDTNRSIRSDFGGRFDQGSITLEGNRFYINGVATFMTVIVPIILPTILLGTQRFPTPESRSRTPPGTPRQSLR